MEFKLAKSMLAEGKKVSNEKLGSFYLLEEGVIALTPGGCYEVVPTIVKTDGVVKTPYEITEADMSDDKWFEF